MSGKGLDKPKKTKHTTAFHLKQLKKAVKRGKIPPEYEKYFKGMKDPISHLKHVDTRIEQLEKQYHKQHKKAGTDYDKQCNICNPQK